MALSAPVKRHKKRRRARVEVRETAAGRELRIDGTFASSYHPGRQVTGSVWDAIAAPLLLLPPNRHQSVLLLGLGGGSAARVVRALAPRARIVGVELDREVVKAARRWFDLDALGIEVVVEDALQFLEHARQRHDLVLDDVFVGSGHAVHKPGWLPRPGHELARSQLREGGLLVSNVLDEAREVTRSMRRLFEGVLRIEVEDYDNQILVGGPAGISGRELRRSVAGSEVLRETLHRLSFRTLKGG
jgi:spermidine synthase